MAAFHELDGEVKRFLKMFRLEKYETRLQQSGKVTDLKSLSSLPAAFFEEELDIPPSDVQKLLKRAGSQSSFRDSSPRVPRPLASGGSFAAREADRHASQEDSKGGSSARRPKSFSTAQPTPLMSAEEPKPEVEPTTRRFLFTSKFSDCDEGLAQLGLLSPAQLLEFCRNRDNALAVFQLPVLKGGMELSSFRASALIKAVTNQKDANSIAAQEAFRLSAEAEAKQVTDDVAAAAASIQDWESKKGRLKGKDQGFTSERYQAAAAARAEATRKLAAIQQESVTSRKVAEAGEHRKNELNSSLQRAQAPSLSSSSSSPPASSPISSSSSSLLPSQTSKAREDEIIAAAKEEAAKAQRLLEAKEHRENELRKHLSRSNSSKSS
jgi:hypothetical protein